MKTEQEIKIERLEEEVKFLKSVITNYQDVVSRFNDPQPIEKTVEVFRGSEKFYREYVNNILYQQKI